MKKDKNKTLMNLKKFNNAFKKELKAKIYSGGGDPTPLSVMNTLIFEDQRKGAPKILLEDESPEETEAIIEDKSIEQIREENIVERKKKIDDLWNNGKKPKKEPSYYQTGKEYLNPFNYFGTGKKEPEKKPKPWTKETFITHLKKKGQKTDDKEIQNYIAEKFSISDRDFENKMKEAMYKKRQKDEENLKYIANNSERVKENINKLFKRTQEIEQAKQEAKRTLKSTPKTKQEPIKEVIKKLDEEKDKLKKNSSSFMEQEEELEKMQAEVTNTSILPNLNELLKAEGKSPFSEEAFNRRIKGNNTNTDSRDSTNMNSFYDELEEGEQPEGLTKPMPSKHKHMKQAITSFKSGNPRKLTMKASSSSKPISVSDDGGGRKVVNTASNEPIPVSDDGGGGRKVGNKSSNEPISISDDREVVNTASNRIQPDGKEKRTRTQTNFFKFPEAKEAEDSKTSPQRSRLPQRPKINTKNRTSNRKALESADPLADEDDAMNWEDFNEESEEPEEKSSERKEPKFIEPEVEEAFEFSHTINSENKTIIRNIIKNLNGILSAPILTLSTGSKSDIKHVNNVIIYDEIREGEERLKKMSEDSIYVPKYIPQLPSEQ